MSYIDKIPDTTIINTIKNYDKKDISSFSLKILLGQLKVKLDLSNDPATAKDCINKLKEYFNKYGNLPNVKTDVKTLFNINV